MAATAGSAIVVFESVYGNTREVAHAIADGLATAYDARAIAVPEAGEDVIAAAKLIVAGGPTHVHGMASARSRMLAVEAGEEDGIEIDRSAREQPSLRTWLSRLDGNGTAAAAFDTRIDKHPALTGSAARGIARRLRRKGCELIADPESFFVEDSEGPLADGELERARAWGERLAAGAAS